MIQNNQSKALIYAENEGEVAELKGCTIEALFCCTHDKKVCFCWIKVQERKEPYRFFVENANSCFFEQFSFENYEEEIEEFQEEDELTDLAEELSLKKSIIQKVYVDADKEDFTYIDLIIELTSGTILKLHDNDYLCGESYSTVLFKSQDKSDYKVII